MRRLHTSQLKAAALKAGESLLLSGFIFTARDAAHQRISDLLNEGKPPPFPLDGAVIYYAGPAPAPPGRCIGSCGPTTSGRMDSYTPELYSRGVVATIGKGERDAAVCGAIRRYDGLYLCAVGGAGALLASCVREAEIIAFEELGCEAVRRLSVEGFPLMVAIDSYGGNLYER